MSLHIISAASSLVPQQFYEISEMNEGKSQVTAYETEHSCNHSACSCLM